MNGVRRKSRWRTLLCVALCYAVALQAILAAFTTIVNANMPGFAGLLVICHDSSSNEDTGGPQPPPCGSCTLVAPMGAPPDPLPLGATLLRPLGLIDFAARSAVVAPLPVRAGHARAPPRFA